MPGSSQQPSAETLALARQLYVDGVAVREILDRTKLSKVAFYRCIDGRTKGGMQWPAIPRRQLRARSADNERGKLVERLWRTARLQVDDIQKRITRAARNEDGDDSTRERDARTLAVLIKTLRELAAFDAVQAMGKPGGPTRTDAEDDRGPRDIDEFRRELVRRMDAIVAARKARVPGEPDGGED